MSRQTNLLGRPILILAILLFIASAVSAVPAKIPINGRLTFSNDTDINGTANFTFTIYNNKTGGDLLWRETQQNITVRRGLLSTFLGNNTPINLSFDANYFLEIAVNGETIEPRFEFGTSAYSFASNQTLFTKNDTQALGNITPVTNNSFNLGNSGIFWLAGYFTSLFVRGDLNITNGNLYVNGVLITNQTNITIINNVTSQQEEADNTTQNNLIAANNQTLTNLKANLTTENTFTGMWNYFANLTANMINTTGGFFQNGVDLLARINSNNQTISDNLSSVGTRIGSLETKQSADNTTLSGRIDAITGGTNDNTTQNDLITGNNNTITALLGQKVNITNFLSNNNTIVALIGTKVNLTDLTSLNNTIYGSLGQKVNITDFTSNNNTIVGLIGTKINLTASSSFQCTSGEYIGNVTTLGGVVISVVCYNQSGSNDNTTQSSIITGNNNTLTAGLGTKVNLTASSSVQCTDGEYLDNVTTIGGVIIGYVCKNQSGGGASSDNTTQANLIAGNNQTLTDRITGNNNTLTASLGQKLNLTGGTLSGPLTVQNVSTANNLSLNVSDTLFVNRSQGFIGVGTSNPSTKFELLGTLTVEGVNITGRQSSDNTTTSNRIGSLETKQSADNTTLSNRMATQEADNTTTGSRIGSLETKQSSDNTTLTALIGTKINLTASSSSQCAGSNKVTNVTFVGGAITVECGSDLTGGGSSDDNTTLTDLINSNNRTLTNLKANLTTDNNFTGTWNWFRNITADQGNFTRDLFVGGVAVYGRLNSNNQTLLDLITGNNQTVADNLTFIGTRIGNLETKQSSDNTTLGNRIAGNNNTLTASLGQKLNLTGGTLSGQLAISNTNEANNISLSVNGSLYVNSSGRVGINTTSPRFTLEVAGTFNATGGIPCTAITGGSDSDFCADDSEAGGTNDNTTQNNLITGNNQTLTDLISGNNNTVYGSIGQKVNITDLTSANITIYGSLGQKLNLTGGTLSGILTILNVSTVNNLSLNATTVLFVNSSYGFVGIGTPNPASKLDVSGTLTVEGINVTGRQIADNSTTGSRIGALETKQSADNTTLGNRVGNLETKQSSDNITLGNRIGSLETKQSADNTTQNDKINSNNQTLSDRIDAVSGGTSDNTTQGNLITGNNNTLSNRITGNNQTLADLITGNNNTLYALHGQQPNLSSINNFTGAWNWFRNITADQLNITRDVFIGGVAVYGRLNSNNQTLVDLITGNNNTLDARIDAIEANNQTLTDRMVGDNTTQGDRIAGDNTTQGNAINTKINTTGGSYQANLTILGLLNVTPVNSVNNLTFVINDTVFFNASSRVFNVTTGISCGMITGGTDGDFCVDSEAAGADNDNTTQNNKINANNQTLADLITGNNNTLTAGLGQKVNITDFLFNNNTIVALIGTKTNLTDLTSANNTIYGSLGQKLNLTGGVLSGALTIINVSAINNLSLNVTTVLFVNSTFGWVGINTPNPSSMLDISGTLTVQGINVTGRHISDNTTIAGNLTSIGTRLGNLETRQSADNTTHSDAINAKVSPGDCGTGFVVQNTTTGGVECVPAGGSGYDDTIINQTIGQKANQTEFVNTNTTVFARINGNNQTLADLIAGNNNTLFAVAGQKLNLTGGILSGLLLISNSSLANNLSLNVSGILYVNKTGDFGYIGIFTTSPSSLLHVNGNVTISGSLFLDGFNVSLRITSNNQTLSDLIVANNNTLTTRLNGNNQTLTDLITGNNNTLGARIDATEANNQTLNNRISGDNTTQSSLITGNNQTLTDRINADNTTHANLIDGNNQTLTNLKANLTTTNNFTSGEWHGFGNISTRGQINASSINISGGISCGMITGGSDTDYCDDATGGGSADDNTTQADAINTKVNITDFLSNNNTINGLIGTKVNLTDWLSNNNTIQSDLGLKVNITLWLSNNDTIWSDLGAKVNISLWLSNNATIQADIGKKVNITDFLSNNQTLLDLISGNNNTLGNRVAGNNQTLSDLIGANNQTLTNLKFNVTGGVFTGNVNVSTIANLTLTTARLNITQNTTIRNTNNAGNNSAILFYDTSGACRTRMYYNGTHFVISGC